MSRLRTLQAGTARTAQIAAAIRAAADNPSIVMVRLQLKWTRDEQPYRQILAYDNKFQPTLPDPDAIDAIDALLRGARPDIDWFFDHDYHLDTGMLRRSPAMATDRGAMPEKDKTFGGTAPVFLIDDAPAPVPIMRTVLQQAAANRPGAAA